MKKILSIILLVCSSYLLRAQFSITQNLGSPSTLVKNPNYGGLQGGLIPFTFTDTSSANTLATALKTYSGALIYTTSPRAVWWRDAAVSTWLQLLPSGGSTGTLAWTMGGNNPVVTDGSGYGLIGPQTSNGISAITNNLVRFSINTSGAFGLGSGRDFGTSGHVLQSNGSGSEPSWVDHATLTTPLSKLTAATATNSIDNANYGQTWEWNTLTTGSGLILSINGTNAGSGQTVLSVLSSGANASANRSTYAGVFQNSKTGTNATNYGINVTASGGTTNRASVFSASGAATNNYGATFSASGAATNNYGATFSASGGTNNYAIIVPASSGSVGIGTSAPDSTLHVVGGFKYANGSQGAGKYLTSDANGGATWSTSSTPTWQQTLTAGSTLTGNNTIAGGGFDFTWNNIGAYAINSSNDFTVTNTATANTQMSFGDSGFSVDVYTGSHSSRIQIYPDTIILKPLLGLLHIDTLANLSTQDELLGRKNSTGQVGYITVGSGLSLSSGALSASVTASSTTTFTNKRWTARVGSTTSSATPTINTDNYDIYKLTAQTADITSMTTNLSGTPVDGDILEVQITGTAARAITWGASFVSSTVTLPTTTVTTATLTVILQYYSTSSYGNNKWVCVNYY